jgi:hypothetical protein
MSIYTLYVKTHKITGLKYLGQTKQDPNIYTGSGIDWKAHLKIHGRCIDTEILFQSSNKTDIVQLGEYYSNKWHILSSQDDFGNKIWANRVIENGAGGGRISGTYKHSDKTKAKLRKKAVGRICPDETAQKIANTMKKLFETKEQWNKGIKTTNLYTKEERQKKFGNKGKLNPMFGKSVPKLLCPHCGKNMDVRNYSRYHGNNCKYLFYKSMS